MNSSKDLELRKELETVKKRLILLIVIGILVIALVILNKFRFIANPTPILPKVKIGETEIFVELAETSEEKSRGLSGRNILKDNEGMLFVFENDTYPAFWMKDMLIPIDIIWINDSKIVYIHEDVPKPQKGTPNSQLQLYRPPDSVDYVLEVKAGLTKKRGIRVGDPIDLSQI